MSSCNAMCIRLMYINGERLVPQLITQLKYQQQHTCRSSDNKSVSALATNLARA